MKKILLVCAAGMSTSLLVRKMEQAAKEKNEEIIICATGQGEVKKNIRDTDILLLGPQVSYKEDSFIKEYGGVKGIPVKVINTVNYGMMDGKKVLEWALSLINK